MPLGALLGPPIESDDEDAAQEFEPQEEGENDHEFESDDDEPASKKPYPPLLSL